MSSDPKDNDTPETGEFRRSVVSGFAWQGITKLFVQVATWGSTIVVARILVPADYGILAVSGVFTGLLAMLVELGLSYGLIQKPEVTRKEEDGVFYISLCAGLLLYGLLFLAAPAIARFYDMEILSPVLRVAGLGLIIGSLKGVPLAIAMRRMDFRYRSLTEVGTNLTSAVTVVTLAVYGFGVWSLVYSYLLAHLLESIIYLRLLKRIPDPRFTWSVVADVFGYGAKITANNLLYFVYSRADVMIIGKLLGEKLLGYYSMAFQLATIPLDKVGSIFNQVTFPAMARIQSDPEESRRLFIDLHRHLLIISWPILVGLALVADDLIVLLLTEKWQPLVPVLQAFCVINMLRVSGMLFTPVLNGRGKAGVVLRYATASAIVLPLAFLIGAGYGIMGVMAAWMIAYPPLYLILLINCLRDLELPPARFLRSTTSAFVATLIMGLAVFATSQLVATLPGAVRLAAMIGVGIAAYAGTFFLLFRGQIKQVRNGIRMLRSGTAP